MLRSITVCPGSQKVVMRRAWDLARQGQRVFGGQVRQYLGQALRLCWAELKADPAAKAAAELVNHCRARRAAPPKVIAPTPYLAKFATRQYRSRVWGSAYL